MFCEHNTPNKNLLNLGIVVPAPLNEHSFRLKKIKKTKQVFQFSQYISLTQLKQPFRLTHTFTKTHSCKCTGTNTQMPTTKNILTVLNISFGNRSLFKNRYRSFMTWLSCFWKTRPCFLMQLYWYSKNSDKLIWKEISLSFTKNFVIYDVYLAYLEFQLLTTRFNERNFKSLKPQFLAYIK